MAYIVIKTIKGRQYRYLQRSYRVGKKVRTESKYLCPVGGGGSSPAASSPSYSTSAPRTPERSEVMKHFTQVEAPSPDDPLHPMDQVLTGSMRKFSDFLEGNPGKPMAKLKRVIRGIAKAPKRIKQKYGFAGTLVNKFKKLLDE